MDHRTIGQLMSELRRQNLARYGGSEDLACLATSVTIRELLGIWAPSSTSPPWPPSRATAAPMN